MRNLLKRIPFLNALAAWAWHLMHLRNLVAAQEETRLRIEDLIGHIGGLHHDVNVLKHNLVVMKQDLTVLRQENEDLRGIGTFVPKLEAHDTAIEQIRQDLAIHRDSTHQLHEGVRRQIANLNQAART